MNNNNFTMMTIDCVFNGNLWRGEANGKAFFVALTKTQLVLKQMYSNTFVSRNIITDQDETWYEIKVNGFDKPIPAINRGTPIRIGGYFQNDDRDNEAWQFKLVTFELFSGDEITSLRYLKKIGIKWEDAQNLVQLYGTNIYSYVYNKNFRNTLLESTSEKKTDEIIKKLQRTISEYETFNIFSKADISYPFVIKAVKFYGLSSSYIAKTNPYKIGLKIGLSFRLCDKLAQTLGFSANHIERFSALSHVLMSQRAASGNIYTPTYLFKKMADFRINKSIFPNISTTSSFLSLKDEEYDTEDGLIFSKSLKKAEERAAQNIKRLSVNKAEPFREDYIPLIEKACNMKFGKEQRMAFDMFKSRGIKILTGGPGTGKTTTVKGIIMNYRMMHPNHKIELGAPTGRAAQRLAESTELPARTVHKLLNYVPYGDNPSCKDSNDPIDADFVVIDECSMLDIELFDKLLDALKTDTTLLLVGDIHQLESVGPGAVLRDLLATKSLNIESTFLNEVFRQKGGSPIIDNSIKINQGLTNLSTSEDFTITNLSSQKEMFEKIKQTYMALYNKDDLYETQILCPTYKGDAGIDKLNEAIRDMINPNGKSLTYGYRKYRVNDKVILTRNNLECGYYNGDIGIIKYINDDSLVITIKDEDIELKRENFDDVSLAYAITVHRSQGSEFKNVIISLPKEPRSMLVRNLFYTAVTRAKKQVHIFSEGINDGAIKTAILTDKTDERNTKLSSLIKN